MRASARPEAVAVLAEGGIKERRQHLQQRLLDQTIRHRRDTELALAALGLGDRHPSHRTGPVRSPTTVVRGSQATPCAAARRSGQCPGHPHRLRLYWPAPASTPAAGSLSPAPLRAALTLCPSVHAAGDELHRCPSHTRIHRVLPRAALLAQASDAMLATSTWRRTLPLVRPFAGGTASQPLIRPRMTSRAGSTP